MGQSSASGAAAPYSDPFAGTRPGAPLGAAWDALRMLPANLGFWLSRAWRRPPAPVRCADIADFVGLNVAPGPTEAHDEYVLSLLADLGVRRVRMDFGDTPLLPHAMRLARSAAAKGISVVAHMVQDPVLGAETSAVALGGWSDLCRRVTTELSGSIEAVEAGSAPNRHRWSGHTLDGYLATAGAVFRAAAEARLAVWAPNVNDFEPYTSIGILAALRRRGLVPDRHTVNLFVDRAGCPEARDPHAWPVRLDLAGKAALLAAAGARFGCRGTVSTYAYWTLDTAGRGRRRYVGEREYAALCVRYLAMAASCGSLDRAYWGQAINHPKGIVDDGSGERPRPPAAHHMFLLRGEPSAYRRRPACGALKAMLSLVGGCSPTGVEEVGGARVARFSGAGSAWALAWSPSGSVPAPGELLDGAEEIRDLAGAALRREEAVALSQSPLYFRLPAGGEAGRG